MEDGRASFRQIAARASLTTPTVSARVARMTKAGLIKKFVPVLSGASVDRGVLVLLTLKVGFQAAERVAKSLAKLHEVEEVYVTSEQTVVLKVALDNLHDLQPFLKRNVLGREGTEVKESQIVTSVVKEEPPSRLPGRMNIDLKCDYCHGDVTSNRPYTLAAGPSHYYFCCRTCRKAYLEKYGARLAKLGRSVG